MCQFWLEMGIRLIFISASLRRSESNGNQVAAEALENFQHVCDSSY